jgi:hypothetical protein
MSQQIMKLRLLDNSIRMRLTRPEVEAALNNGLVKGQVTFAGKHSFSYVLESSPATVKTDAQISNNQLTVTVPESEIRDWADSDQVTISAEQALDDGTYLKILVEKDFACLAPRDGEDESDMFPHPNAGQDSC